MAFMIVAVFIFFLLAGLFFLRIQVADTAKIAGDLKREEAISSIKVIADMPELAYDSSDTMTLDSDKLSIMITNFSESYEDFWPVASIEVYKVYPKFEEVIECPAPRCNYYKIYDNGQKSTEKMASFISICKGQRISGTFYETCEIGKILVGIEKNEK